MYRIFFLCSLYLSANLANAEPLASRTVDPNWRCGTPALRSMNSSRVPVQQIEETPSSPAAPVHVGQIERFFTHIPEQSVKGTCIAIGEHIYLYVENSMLLQNMMTQAEASEIVKEFDSHIYPQVHRWIGLEWRPGLDRDTKITLLMHDVGLNGSGAGFGGYFSSRDQNPTGLNSNCREIVFMDIFQFKERSRFTFYNSLAHEFTHLVNWFQNGGHSDERWLEEGLASFAEWAIYGNIHTLFVDGYFENPSVSLTSGNTADVYYGGAFMLLLYLFEHHGGQRFIRELARQDVLGIQGINAALTALNRPERFADVFQNWALANFVNDLRRGGQLGYSNMPNQRVNSAVHRISNFPISRSGKLKDWGVQYVEFRNLPNQIEIALDGTGDGILYAQIARLSNNDQSTVQPVVFDEGNHGLIALTGLTRSDRVIMMVTTTTAQSFRYEATVDGTSSIVVGPPRVLGTSTATANTTTKSIGKRSKLSYKRSNIDFRLEPITQVHLSSNYQDVCIVGELAYVVSDWGLEIFNLTTPSQPKQIGEIATPGNAQGIVVHENTAYVADGDGGVVIIDVNQSNAPKLTKIIGGFEHVRCIHIANRNAYVVDVKQGLKIFSLKELLNGTNPQPIGAFYTTGAALDVSVDRNMIYLSDENLGFHILDFELVDIPAFAGIVRTLAFDFDVADGYAYVASGNFQIIDMRNRLEPEIISSIQTPGLATQVKYKDGYAYLTDQQSGLYIIDVHDRQEPKTIAVQPLLNGTVGLDILEINGKGKFACVANGKNGLQIISLKNPAAPEWLHHYDASGEAYGLDIVGTADGRRMAYIADGAAGLKIVEIKDAFNAVLTHHIPLDGIAADVRVENGHAFIAAAERGLLILDIENADNPRMVAHIQTAHPAWGIEIKRGHAYVCADELIVVDSRTPEDSRIVTQRAMPGSAYRITIANQQGYVVALDGGLQIFDLADPLNPRAIGSYQTPGNATNIAIAGNKGYLLDSLSGLQIVELDEPQRPETIAEYQTNALPIAAQISGDYLYLLNQRHLQIINSRNHELISSPHFQAALRFPSEIVVINDAVYVTDLYDLRIFKTNERLFDLSVPDAAIFEEPLNQRQPIIAQYKNRLRQNFPNPFNPETWIPYEVGLGGNAELQIYNTQGTLIHRLNLGHKMPGTYATRDRAAYWDGRSKGGELFSSGTYFYRIIVGNFSAVRQMVILK